jgi:ADP-ribosylglycohydrolase
MVSERAAILLNDIFKTQDDTEQFKLIIKALQETEQATAKACIEIANEWYHHAEAARKISKAIAEKFGVEV